MKATPMPWRRAPGRDGAALRIIGANGCTVASIPNGDNQSRIEADSALLVHAAELVNAVKAFLDQIGDMTAAQFSAGKGQVDLRNLRRVMASILEETEEETAQENTDLDELDGAAILDTLNGLPMADRSLVLDLIDRLAQDVPSIQKETEG